ncbi:MAG: hypothetical protein ACI8TP_002638 [Acidimicrobiales bacterium]|jgi:hypothetical protein
MNDKELIAGLAATPGYRYAEVEGNHLDVAGPKQIDRGIEMGGRPGKPSVIIDTYDMGVGVLGGGVVTDRQIVALNLSEVTTNNEPHASTHAARRQMVS